MPIESRKGSREWLKNRDKFMSGFCNDFGKPGQHEGHKPKSHSGKPMPTCPFWNSCPCSCHRDIDNLFEMTGQPRVEVLNADYKPEKGEFLMPLVVDPITGALPSLGDGVMASSELEATHAPLPAVPTTPLAQRRTTTGRAARGGLEAQTWEACRELALLDPLTPKVVSEWIGSKYTIPNPSTGAIRAVWVRWDGLGFAGFANKPLRFTGFKKDGTWEELERIKTSRRTAERSSASAARRGYRTG